ncbi:MAG: hypothetical protein LBN30_10220 [Oscillospiraceae bacterium]|jgi:hypothetical protein|nr:hypothetical protein [Oscillospiraceae bacterium]
MDLKSGKITLGELMREPRAKALLTREFPQYDNPLTLTVARGFTLNKILDMAKGNVPQAKLDEVVAALAAL